MLVDTQGITQHRETEEVARIAFPGCYQGQHLGAGSASRKKDAGEPYGGKP